LVLLLCKRGYALFQKKWNRGIIRDLYLDTGRGRVLFFHLRVLAELNAGGRRVVQVHLVELNAGGRVVQVYLAELNVGGRVV
jgi:hypothetical protein